jgi:hypothetical protein
MENLENRSRPNVDVDVPTLCLLPGLAIPPYRSYDWLFDIIHTFRRRIPSYSRDHDHPSTTMGTILGVDGLLPPAHSPDQLKPPA